MFPLLLALALLLSADVPSPPADASTIRAVWLADLTPEQVASPRNGRFVFVPDSLVDEHDGCCGLEAAGPPGVSRTVQFAKGETDEGLALLRPSSSRTSSSSSGTRRGTSSRPSPSCRCGRRGGCGESS